ncbi:hypothetical protein L484_022757 [Morus notabilis]|uniref:Uncharacterized protein n=1 Tax=Morus notabilis TaxID=981085 RepID=W9SMN4_9ROSA|nr:hypothetical protein L484_022757 [Morus notabilis]
MNFFTLSPVPLAFDLPFLLFAGDLGRSSRRISSYLALEKIWMEKNEKIDGTFGLFHRLYYRHVEEGKQYPVLCRRL